MAANRLSSMICLPLLFGMLATLVTSAASAQGMQTEEHKILQQEVGTWDAACKVWQTPNAEPMEFSGSETNELFGGMWLISKFEGKLGDMPFTGRGTTGYDPAEKQYVGTWIDSISPYLTVMKGDYDSATKTLTMRGDMRDAMTGKASETKQVWHYIDNNTRTFEIHGPGEDGKEFKMMEIKYTRSGE
jgi:hypothetical protein